MPEPLLPGPPEGTPPPGANLRATWPDFCEHVSSVEITVFKNGEPLFKAEPVTSPYDFYAADYPASTYTASVVGKTAPVGCEMSEAPS